MDEVDTLTAGLVGRERECAEVVALVNRARRDRSGVVVVRGEPGIGKTALLDYAAEVGDGMTVLRAVGVDAESDLAFAGLFGLLRPVLNRIDQLVEIQARALAGALGVAPSLGIDRFLVAAAAVGLLAAAAEERPVLCLVDDAQWLDTPSVDALSFVARRLGAEPIAMVFGAREGEARRFEGAGLPELALAGLDGVAARSLLSRHSRDISPGVRDRLVAEAAGNPLALLELPSGLNDAELAGQEPLPDAIPLTPRLEALFRRRIEQLPSEARTALLIAAVDNTGDLAAVLRAANELELGADALDPAERAGLIHTYNAAMAFRHPLVRAAAYEAAALSERQCAHAALARVLSGDEHADRRVWHQAMASVTGDEEVASALEASARRAQLRGGHASAATAFERAAELTVDDSRQGPRLAAAANAAWDAGQADRALELITRALPGAGGTLAARLLHLHGVIESQSGSISDGVRTLTEAATASTDPSLTLEVLREAVSAATAVSDYAAARRFGEWAVALPARTPRDRFNKASVIAYGALCGGDRRRAREAFGEALEQARELDDPIGQLRVAKAASLGIEPGAGLPFALRAVELARNQGLLSLLPQALDQQAAELARNSRFDEAYAAAEEGYQLSEQLGQGLEAFLLETMAGVDAICGREADAREHAHEVMQLAQQGKGNFLATAARATLGLLELALGRADQAAAILLELVAKPPQDMLLHLGMVPVPSAVEAVMRSSQDTTLVAGPLKRYRDWVCAVPTDGRRSLLARCEALTEARDPNQAFAEAIGLADALPPFERARTELLYGEWLRRKRRRTDARPHLRFAAEQLHAIGASPWAVRAEAELRASGETARKREPSTRDQLTPRERTIAELAATGLTNPEIGAQLFLSPRTVEYHLGKVFMKLGIASRTELVRDRSA